MDMGNNLLDFLVCTEDTEEVSKTECQSILAKFAAGARSEAADAPVYEEQQAGGLDHGLLVNDL